MPSVRIAAGIRARRRGIPELFRPPSPHVPAAYVSSLTSIGDPFMSPKLTIPALFLLLSGCNPHVTIDQSKPIEINLNITGRVDLVIHAQQEMESITGEKPTHTVRPEDIGLPPATGGAGSATEAVEQPLLAEADLVPVLLRSSHSGSARVSDATHFVALIDDLKKSLAARDKLVRPLWDAKLVGESHTGLLEVKGTLTAEQKKLVDEENADRKAFLVEDAKAQKITPEQSALLFYQARLGYAKNGAWYEKRNASGTWEWKQWGM